MENIKINQYLRGAYVATYRNIRTAENQTKIDASHILDNIRGTRPNAGGYTWSIAFRDSIVESVTAKFTSRSNTGFKKYGKTLAEDYKAEWLTDIQEELMDAILYIEKEVSNDR